MKKYKNLVSHISTILLIITSSLVTDVIYAKNTWKLEKDDDSIKVFLRNTPGAKIKSFKGAMLVNSNLSALVSVFNDVASYPRWLHNTRSAKTLSNDNKNNIINYVVTDMPWPVADRDAVITSSLVQNAADKSVVITLNTKPNHIDKVEGKVRIQSLSGNWRLNPVGSGLIEVVYEMSIDPGGNIPKWVVNAMTVDLPFYTLKNLRNIIKQPQYVNSKVEEIVE